MTSPVNGFMPEIEAVKFDNSRAAAMIDRACREISQVYASGCWEWAAEHERAKFEAAREAERLAEKAFIRRDMPSLENQLAVMVDGWKDLIEEFKAREQGKLF